MRLLEYVLQTFLVNIFSLAIANFSIFKMANGNFKMAAKFICQAEQKVTKTRHMLNKWQADKKV